MLSTNWGVAVNLNELATGSHSLSVVDNVYVTVHVSEDQNYLPRYYFSLGLSAIFYAKITGSSVITTNRWTYSFVEVKLNVGGTFNIKPDGVTGTAYNTIEANNGVCGIMGSGDDCDVFPTGITELPIGIGAVVRMSRLYNCEEPPVLEYVFTLPNNAGGEC